MSSDWWAKKLGGTPAPMPQTTMPAAPQQVQQHAAQQHTPVRPDAQTAQPESMSDALAQMDPDKIGPTKSQKAGNVSTCPECGSGNYFTHIKSTAGLTSGKTSRERCYDCGYPITHGLNA